jgi:hypothetical protein
MVGGNHLAHLDELRGDQAGTELRVVAAPPTTAAQLLRRLSVGQCRARWPLGNRFDRHLGLSERAPVTLDMDGALTEVCGRRREMASINREGKLASSSWRA